MTCFFHTLKVLGCSNFRTLKLFVSVVSPYHMMKCIYNFVIYDANIFQSQFEQKRVQISTQTETLCPTGINYLLPTPSEY